MPDFAIENTCPPLVCGIDEVGRGPLAGPVIAAAVIIHPHAYNDQSLQAINDSKKISAKKRALICQTLPDVSISAIGMASVEEIDRINIYQATFVAMQRAFQNLQALTRDPIRFALIDGNKTPDLPCPSRAVVKGDGKSLSIAAASIVAKEHRDRLMSDLAQQHPEYGWERNAGYGTKQHLSMLKTHGATQHHRKTFKPVHEAITASY